MLFFKYVPLSYPQNKVYSNLVTGRHISWHPHCLRSNARKILYLTSLNPTAGRVINSVVIFLEDQTCSIDTQVVAPRSKQ